MKKIKGFIPLIITSAVLILAVIANIITACIDVENMPVISYNDVPSTEQAYIELESAQKEYNSAQSELKSIDSEIKNVQGNIDYFNNRITNLNTEIEELNSRYASIAEINERYKKCLAEAQRLNDKWSVYRDVKLECMTSNYDANNLRANQNNSNIYTTVGEHTGFWGSLLADQLNTSIYRGYDNIINSVNIITETANVHLYNADMLLAKIQAKIDSADSLLNEEIEGDNLLFEVELFESAYFGKDDLFEEERKALVYELDYSYNVLRCIYPVYEMMLTDCQDNSQFLIRLHNKIVEIENLLYAISESESEMLSEEEKGEIAKDVYGLIPGVCDVITDGSHLTKGIRTISPLAGNKFYRSMKNESYFFLMRQYDYGNKTPIKEFYFNPDGNLIYAQSGGDIICRDLEYNIVLYRSCSEERCNAIIQDAQFSYQRNFD